MPAIQRKLHKKKDADFLLSKMFMYDIPHFYIIWKTLKNPIVGDQLWQAITGY